jgi:peptidoglycan hydrolase-like protein with peptidoglycan-binding domain
MSSSVPDRPSRARRLVLAALAAGAVCAGLLAQAAEPAQAATAAPATAKQAGAPGSLTGYAFDTCTAPPQQVMDAWWQESPYSAVGVYIGGSNRVCEDQTELTAAWVGAQQRTGWHLLPIEVGPQASCSGYADKMSPDLATAHQQGIAEAAAAVASAQGLGIGQGSTLYYDLEDYDVAPNDCRQAALSFMSGWTEQLHVQHYVSGVYSNIAAAINSLDVADRLAHGYYTMPDDIWFAWANDQVDTEAGPWVLSDAWDDHARIHQYAIDSPQSYGGYPLTVDASWVDVGTGSVGTPTKPLCRGVDVDLRRYPTLLPGSRGPGVAVAQCILRTLHLLAANPSGRYDARTVKAVKKAQRKLHQRQTGKLTRHTWVALLARGPQPLLKVGSTGDPVRRLQRALTAALGKRVAVDGALSQATERRVLAYQRKAGLPVTGVVTDDVWARLNTGR